MQLKGQAPRPVNLLKMTPAFPPAHQWNCVQVMSVLTVVSLLNLALLYHQALQMDFFGIQN